VAQIRRAFLYFAIVVAVMYGADYLSARSNALGSVQVQPYYAIHLKNKKLEYNFDVPQETERCVQSIAPHLGFQPCWYVRRHVSKRIDE